jgi:neurocan core protein
MRAGTMLNARRIGAIALAVGALAVGPLSFVAPSFVGPSLAGAAEVGRPSAPRSLRTTPGNARATVRWHPPDHLNGSPVGRYRIVAYDVGNNPLPTREFVGSKTTYVYPGLQNGKVYTFTVSAKNKSAWSPLSARSQPVKIGVPLQPGAPTAVAGVGRATVSWHASADNGATVKAYRVTPILDGHATAARTYSSPKTKQVLTGLKHGRRYTFVVAAHNNRGWSALSHPTKIIIVK